MNIELKNLPLLLNEQKKHFELQVNGFIAYIEYGGLGNQLTLLHTIVPEELAGQGIGTVLVEKTLAHIKSTEKTILPFCPFVFSYLKKHSEWKFLVDKRFKKYNEL